MNSRIWAPAHLHMVVTLSGMEYSYLPLLALLDVFIDIALMDVVDIVILLEKLLEID